MTGDDFQTVGVDFNRYASNVHSQCGEDGIIAAILEALPQRDSWAVEFGAWDGTSYSNTALLADQGASRVLIEGSRSRYEKLRKAYEGDSKTWPICEMVDWDGSRTLDAILADTPIPSDFDVLSIDIDGNDYHVWKAVTSYRPKLVVIEFNPTIRNGVLFVQDRDPTLHQSSSISSLVELGKEKEYELVAATEYNALFVRSDLFAGLGLADNTVEALRTDTSWQTDVFFGFDGHAYFSGGRGLEWHRVPQPTDVRVVPRLFDGFPGDFGLPRRALFAVWRRRVQRRSERRLSR